MSTRQLFNYAVLSQASYSYFTKPFADKDRVEIALQVPKQGDFSPTQAQKFLEEYELLDHLPNTASGFSASVFVSSSGEYIMAVRGTEIVISDIITDAGDIGFNGIAVEQAIDLFNYYQRSTATEGQTFLQLDYDDDNPLSWYVDQVTASETGVLAGKDFTAVGHSLGGHLAMILSRLAGDRVTSVYTFNAPGFDTSLVPLNNDTETLFQLIAQDQASAGFPVTVQPAFDAEKMTHLVTKGDLVSRIGEVPGEQQITFDEKTGAGGAHSIVDLADALALEALFEQLDPTISLSEITALLEITSNVGDNSLERALDVLRQVILNSTTTTSRENREDFYQNLYALAESDTFKAYAGKLCFQSVALGETLDAVFQEDTPESLACRYALRELNPFAVVGIDYNQYNQNGALDLYDPETGEGMLTEAWLAARAEMLDWKRVFNEEDRNYADALSDWSLDGNFVYTDLASGTELTVDGNLFSGDRHRIFFDDAAGGGLHGEFYGGRYGGQLSDWIFGSNGDDSLFGAGGDDLLEGRAGDDSLRGGEGADTLRGGNGNDSLYGDAGDDLLEGEFDDDTLSGGEGCDTLCGGNGNDSLDGGKDDDLLEGGGGNDTLMGGEGTDTLRGGAGNDRYEFSGDFGQDVIEDEDGQGTIHIGGIQVGNLKEFLPNIYRDDEGYFQIVRMDGGATLSLTSFIPGNRGHVSILDWSNGQLGIDLEDKEPVPVDPTIMGDIKKKIVVESDTEKYVLSSTGYAPEDETVPGDEPGAQDILVGTDGNDTILGLGGNDGITGGTGDDYIDGGDGNDLLYGGGGADTVLGGAGNDYIFAGVDGEFERPLDPEYRLDSPEAGQSVVIGGFSWGVFDNGDETYTVYPVSGHTHAESNPGVVADGGAGNDRVIGGGGQDMLYGGEGADTLLGLNGNDLLFGGEGEDWLLGDGHIRSPQVYEYALPELHGNDTLFGGAGNDTLLGGGGNDLLDGGDGNDVIVGDETDSRIPLPGQYHGDDVLLGGDGNDYLYGSGGNDSLHGGDGNDAMRGEYLDSEGYFIEGQYHGMDMLDGGDGDDTLIGDGNDDRLYGGKGDDQLFGDNWGQYDLAVEYFGNDTLDGGEGDDTLTGEGGNDLLLGGDGNDHLEGDSGWTPMDAHGDDTLDGGGGDDTLIGWGGDDELRGGKGGDMLLGDSNDASGVECHGNDRLYGDEGDDLLWGGGGNDTLYGGTGSDGLWGGDGDDSLAGGAGADALYGDDGNDTLVGGAGVDYLDGGEGDDVYIIGRGEAQGENYVYDGIEDSGGDDELVLTEADPGGLVVRQQDDGSLFLGWAGETQGVVIKDAASIERFRIGDAVMTLDEVLALDDGSDAGNGGGQGGNGGNAEENHAPELAGELGGRTATKGVFFNWRFDHNLFVDPDGDSLYYAVTLAGGDPLPDWLTFDSVTRTLFGVPARGDIGELSLEVTVTDRGGLSASETFSLEVEPFIQRYEKGDGEIAIRDVPDRDDGGNPICDGIVRFGEGIRPEDIQLGIKNGALILYIGNAEEDTGNFLLMPNSGRDAIHFSNVMRDGIYLTPVDRFEFADGTVLDYAQLLERGFDLLGGGGDDILRGPDVESRFNGGGGADFLAGGRADDTYYFNLGGGQDVLTDVGGINTIVLGEGLNLADMTVTQSIGMDGSQYLDLDFVGGDRLSLHDGAVGAFTGLRFADGQELGYIDLLARLPDIFIVGGDGNDTLLGLDGDDVLLGGAGDDLIQAGAGADELYGDTGNDTLEGGGGIDTYHLTVGMGWDIIAEDGAEMSVLQLDALALEELGWRRDGDDLLLALGDDSGGARLQDYYQQTEGRWTLQDGMGNILSMEDFLAGVAPQESPAESIAELWELARKQIEASYKTTLFLEGYRVGPDGEMHRYSSVAIGHYDGSSTIYNSHYVADFEWQYLSIGNGIYEYDNKMSMPELRYYEELVTSVRTVENGWKSAPVNGNNFAAISGNRVMTSAGGGSSALKTLYFDEFFGRSESFRIPGESSCRYIYGEDGNAIGIIYQETPNSTPAATFSPTSTAIERYSDEYVYHANAFEFVASDADEIIDGRGFGLIDAGAGNDVVEIHGEYHYKHGVYDNKLGALLYGGLGDDWILGGANSDTLVGGAGDDFLNGRYGGDTYIILPETGTDIVMDAPEYVHPGYDFITDDSGMSIDRFVDEDTSTDTVVLPAGVNRENMVLSWGEIQADNFNMHPMVMSLAWDPATVRTAYVTLDISWSGEERVRIVMPHSEDARGSGIEQIRFADGSSLSMQDLIALAAPPAPDFDLHQGDNVLESFLPSFDTEERGLIMLSGCDGNDTVRGQGWLDGGNGNDIVQVVENGRDDGSSSFLDGGRGSDQLYGGDGNDLLGASGADYWSTGNLYVGGKGRDVLFGTQGSDVYIFNRGDGKDAIGDLYHLGRLMESPSSFWSEEPGTLYWAHMYAELIYASHMPYAFGYSYTEFYINDIGMPRYIAEEWPGLYDYFSDGLNTPIYTGGDTLRFGEGILPSEIRFAREVDDLLLDIGDDEADGVCFLDWFRHDAKPLEKIEFANGVVWDLDTLQTRILAHAPYSVALPANQTAATGQPFEYVFGEALFHDLDGDDLALTMTLADGGALPDWLSFDAETHTLHGTPPRDTNVGNLDLRITATDSDGLQAGQNFGLTVEAGALPNRAPEAAGTIPTQNAVPGDSFAWTLPVDLFTDPDSDELDYIVTLADGRALPGWLVFDPATLTLTGSATESDVGSLALRVTATDPDGASADLDFSLVIESAYNLVAGTATGNVLTGTAGADRILGLGGNDILYGRNGNDRLEGGDGNDTLRGEAGNDLLLGEAGNDTLHGGADDDRLEGGDGNDVLHGDAGNDRLLGDQGNDTLYGDAGDDWLEGGDGNDVLHGDAGNDRLLGDQGNDTLYGDAGDDWLEGGEGNDDLRGEAGSDLLSGGAGNDSLEGGTGNDTLSGGEGSDILDGDAGNDTYIMRLGGGEDTIDNFDIASAVDTLRFEDIASDQLTGVFRRGSDLVLTYGEGDSVTLHNHYLGTSYQIERFEFTDVTLNLSEFAARYPVQLTANADSPTFTGADEIVLGLEGNDRIHGGAGNDRLEGGDGNDTLHGDAGNDCLLGDQGNDTLYGDAGDDTLEGGEGNDILRGEAGDDFLLGGTGSDTLYGAAGNDTLQGGEGIDRLEGGAGNDTYLFGRGDGQDTILDSAGSDCLLFGENIDFDQIWFRKAGSHLEISVIGTEDKVTVNNWFIGTGSRIEQIQAGGATLASADVQVLADAMKGYAPPADTAELGDEYAALIGIIENQWEAA